MPLAIGACGAVMAATLALSAAHPTADAVPHQVQARQVIHRLERDLVTNNYNDLYTLSIASLDTSRAVYLSRIPHNAPPKGTVITIRETGPWAMTTIGNGNAMLTQPIKIEVRWPSHKLQSWGSEITLDYLQKQHRWYFAG